MFLVSVKWNVEVVKNLRCKIAEFDGTFNGPRPGQNSHTKWLPASMTASGLQIYFERCFCGWSFCLLNSIVIIIARRTTRNEKFHFDDDDKYSEKFIYLRVFLCVTSDERICGFGDKLSNIFSSSANCR